MDQSFTGEVKVNAPVQTSYAFACACVLCIHVYVCAFILIGIHLVHAGYQFVRVYWRSL